MCSTSSTDAYVNVSSRPALSWPVSTAVCIFNFNVYVSAYSACCNVDAVLVCVAANARHYNLRPNRQSKDAAASSQNGGALTTSSSNNGVLSMTGDIAINHLFIGRAHAHTKNKMVSQAAPVVPMFPSIVEGSVASTASTSSSAASAAAAAASAPAASVRQQRGLASTASSRLSSIDSHSSSLHPRDSCSSSTSLDSVGVSSNVTLHSDDEHAVQSDGGSESPFGRPSVSEVADGDVECAAGIAKDGSEFHDDLTLATIITKMALANEPTLSGKNNVVGSLSSRRGSAGGDDEVTVDPDFSDANQNYRRISAPLVSTSASSRRPSLKQAMQSKMLSSPPSLPSKIYNPFPSSHFGNSNKRAQHGAKFGLYLSKDTPSTAPVSLADNPSITAAPASAVNSVPASTFAAKSAISRSQINACLNRHYLAEIRQNSARH